MKKLILILSLLSAALNSQVQRSAYVDTDYIIGKMPQYKKAQKQLDALAEQWQKEIQIREKTGQIPAKPHLGSHPKSGPQKALRLYIRQE